MAGEESCPALVSGSLCWYVSSTATCAVMEIGANVQMSIFRGLINTSFLPLAQPKL